MYQIISDSACDLTELYIKKHNIEIVPLTASLDGETYLKDKTEINRKDFYTTMVENPDIFPKTSLPSVESYETVFRKYAEQNIPVVCFTISIHLSGSYNSASMAKDVVEEDYPDAKIVVLDSQQDTVSQALIIDQVVRMQNDGIPFDTMIENTKKLMGTARIFFTVGSLDYLRIGGRIGKMAISATGKLGIKPIIILKDGEVNLGGVGRNRGKLKKNLIQIADKYLTENGKDNFVVSIGYGYDAIEGVAFKDEVEAGLSVKLNGDTNVEIGVITAVHTGPHAIGIGVIQKYETLK
mgnify:FL=1